MTAIAERRRRTTLFGFIGIVVLMVGAAAVFAIGVLTLSNSQDGEAVGVETRPVTTLPITPSSAVGVTGKLSSGGASADASRPSRELASVDAPTAVTTPARTSTTAVIATAMIVLRRRRRGEVVIALRGARARCRVRGTARGT